MAVGLIKLYRSPLREGEPLYALGNIDQGVFTDGVHKGEKKPKLPSVKPEVLEDGRLYWELMDTEANRLLCTGFLPQIENPPFVYSFELPEDSVSSDEVVEVEGDLGETIVKRGRGRPKAGK